MATRSGAILTSVSALEDHDYHQVGPMLMSPPADASPDPTGPACTGCKSSSPLLCANCVIAHQLMVAFEGHHVTNLGQSSNKAVEQPGGQSTNSMDDVRKMVKEGKKKLNELQKTVKSVDYSSSRLTSQ